VAVPLMDASALAGLPEASTHTALPAAPVDPDRYAPTGGGVVHNDEPLPVFDTPGGAAIARLPTTQLGSDTWLPIIARQPGWVRVLLPSRPNGASGWVAEGRVWVAHTPDEVRVRLGERTLRLRHEGQEVGAWAIAVGASATPTPLGRTFILASGYDPGRPQAVVLPLGAHSDSLETFAGGPGTVAIHSWPDARVFGAAVSHGCLRVPDVAMTALTTVPLGTLVVIEQ
jgi:hypothetical protein